MKQLSLMIDLNRCIGCCTCIVACRNFHEIVDHANAMPNDMPYYLRVESRRTGQYPDVGVDTWVVPCQHCPEPQCMASCPVEAINKDPETGIVRIDKETCTGCNAEPGKFVVEKQKDSPCRVNCPAHIHVQGYVGLASQGKYHEALKLIKEDAPLPGVLGRVCPHPCEGACKRGDIDSAVSINAVKRFVADLDLSSDTPYVPELKKKKEEKVAVIGSGPAGLTCAYYLAREGYQVTTFEKAPVLGGMLANAIPSYRLPLEVVEAEIQVIGQMGVTMKTGIEIGKDVTIEDLRKEGFKAFFIAVGTQNGKGLGIEGEELDGVYTGLDYLRKVKLGESFTLGKRVAVIGGGNVAMDAVRSVRRLGAEDAFILYRRDVDQMPAGKDEIEECQEEGIPLSTLATPVRFIGENGRVNAIECIKMQLTEPDESGRSRPEPIAGSEFKVEVDAAIIAIGQEADWTCLTPECACKVTEGGTMGVDSLTCQTDDPDIFAGGDAVTGPRTVVEAIAAGKQAAISIARFISGVDLREGRDKEWTPVEEVQKEKYDPAPRTQMPRVAPEARLKNFEEVQQGLTEEMTSQEGKRCLGCGACCIQACPYGVIQFHGQEGHSHKCDLCIDRVHTGQIPVCVEVCLTDAIAFGECELIRQEAREKGLATVDWLMKESHLYVK
jgi:NADPH-dependent glutamate synthase beta subunit-like oxidoreductase